MTLPTLFQSPIALLIQSTSEDFPMAPRKPRPGTLEGDLRDIALGYPATTEDFPWGERAIKVDGKVFLFMRAEGDTVSFSVKLPASGADALEQAFTEPTHYGLGKKGWVTATVDARRDPPR